MPGKSFDRMIEEAIASCRCAVVLWSKCSIESDWVRGEAEEARNRKILIPAQLDKSKPPIIFRHIQSVDLSTWRGDQKDDQYKSLVLAISGFVNPAITNAKKSSQLTIGDPIQSNVITSQSASSTTPIKQTGAYPDENNVRVKVAVIIIISIPFIVYISISELGFEYTRTLLMIVSLPLIAVILIYFAVRYLMDKLRNF